MAIDPDQVIEDAISNPKKVTTSEASVEMRSADEINALLDRAAARRPRKPPFSVTRGIPPGTVGPNSSE